MYSTVKSKEEEPKATDPPFTPPYVVLDPLSLSL